MRLSNYLGQCLVDILCRGNFWLAEYDAVGTVVNPLQNQHHIGGGSVIQIAQKAILARDAELVSLAGESLRAWVRFLNPVTGNASVDDGAFPRKTPIQLCQQRITEIRHMRDGITEHRNQPYIVIRQHGHLADARGKLVRVGVGSQRGCKLGFERVAQCVRFVKIPCEVRTLPAESGGGNADGTKRRLPAEIHRNQNIVLWSDLHRHWVGIGLAVCAKPDGFFAVQCDGLPRRAPARDAVTQ